MNDQNERDIWKLIQAFNYGRDLDALVQKYTKMRENAFVFFRGTCHLFYRDLPHDSSLNLAPAVWICGDLHLENFGTYKGDNRQIYFGINDFAYRLPSFLVSILGLYSLYRFTLLFYSKKVAVYAALIAASSQAYFLMHLQGNASL